MCVMCAILSCNHMEIRLYCKFPWFGFSAYCLDKKWHHKYYTKLPDVHHAAATFAKRGQSATSTSTSMTKSMNYYVFTTITFLGYFEFIDIISETLQTFILSVSPSLYFYILLTPQLGRKWGGSIKIDPPTLAESGGGGSTFFSRSLLFQKNDPPTYKTVAPPLVTHPPTVSRTVFTPTHGTVLHTCIQ